MISGRLSSFRKRRAKPGMFLSPYPYERQVRFRKEKPTQEKPTGWLIREMTCVACGVWYPLKSTSQWTCGQASCAQTREQLRSRRRIGLS